jgi:hypothetical protein
MLWSYEEDNYYILTPYLRRGDVRQFFERQALSFSLRLCCVIDAAAAGPQPAPAAGVQGGAGAPPEPRAQQVVGLLALPCRTRSCAKPPRRRVHVWL